MQSMTGYGRALGEYEDRQITVEIRSVNNRYLDCGVKLPRTWPFPVQYWRIGDQKLFTFGGELLVGYALDVKKMYGRDTFVMGYCNDVMSYIPTEEAWAQGGYEVDKVYCESGLPAQWTRDVTKRIMDGVKRLAD